MIKNVFVDLDDTLIPWYYVYSIPQLDSVKLICIDLQELAPIPMEIIKMATDWQLKNMEECGFISKTNFPQSFVEVYQELCKKNNRDVNKKIESAIWASGLRYVIQDVKIFPGVKETLEKIHQNKYLVTRGDHDIQSYKIHHTGLVDYFDYLEIVPLKNENTYMNLLKKHQLKAEETIMIGDSYGNDIKPALKTGMKVVHIDPKVSTYHWDSHIHHFEDGLGDYPVVKNFTEVLQYLGN